MLFATLRGTLRVKRSTLRQILIDRFIITSPKRTGDHHAGWNAFFPYYAGFPEKFARELLKSAALPTSAIVLDPWNGSGTTTFAASRLGFATHGFDLNPVMVVVARARLLPQSEADSLLPLLREITRDNQASSPVDCEDSLDSWFGDATAGHLRSIEKSIRRHLVGEMTMATDGTHFERISSIAATFYVALFAVCRRLASTFRSSNPTWLRLPRDDERRVGSSRAWIVNELTANITSMAAALRDGSEQRGTEPASCTLQLADTTKIDLPQGGVDLILTSPPYCTRIDYAVATRIELAVLAPLLRTSPKDLARQMIGSTCVPDREIEPSSDWGHTCNHFLTAMKSHPSKASSGYYYRTHLDYFDKMHRSLSKLSHGLVDDGTAVFVVQDSYYKELHNDLPQMITEMAECAGLELVRREDFRMQRSMSLVNPHSKTYQRPSGVTEAVLCFQKN